MPTDNRATAERIAQEVITIHHPNVQPEPNTGCWLWMGSVSSQGYGRIRGTTRTHMVHRLSFQTAGRVIPPGFVLDHMCRVRSCVNPDHLRAVTVRQNVTENSLSLQAQNKQKSHCPKCGGPYRVDGDRKSVCGERLLNATDQAEYDARLALHVWEVVRVSDGRVMASAHATAPEASEVMRSWNRNAMHGEKYTIRTITEAT